MEAQGIVGLGHDRRRQLTKGLAKPLERDRTLCGLATRMLVERGHVIVGEADTELPTAMLPR